MKVTPEHLDLIARIYDVVLDVERWSEVLDDIARMSNAKFSNLIISDRSFPEIQVQAISASVYNAEALREYNEVYAETEQFMGPNLIEYPIGEFATDEDLCKGLRDYRTLPAIRYLKERYGGFRRIACRLNDSRSWFDALNFCFSEDRGQMTLVERKTASIFIPHIAKAVKIGRPFQVLKHRFNGVLSVLNRFHIGVLILSSSGSIVIKNLEADRILDMDDGLSLKSNNQLKAQSNENHAMLHKAIQAASLTAQSEGENSGTLLSIERRSGEVDYLVEVAPLMESNFEFSQILRGVVVFIIDPVNRAKISTEGMDLLYNLTKTESLVCKLLVDGYETTDIAEIRNVSPETIRTQIKSVLSKTRSSNRADVVRLALTVNLPVDKAGE